MADTALPLPVHKKRRLTFLHARRAATGNPDPQKPDIDDRGYTGTEHGPVIGIMEGQTVTIRLVRDRVDRDAALFASSSDPGVAALSGPAQLPNQGMMELSIRGVTGANPRTAIVKIHFGSAGGPVLFQLGAWVYKGMTISITPHIVSIPSHAGAAAIAPAVNPAPMFAANDDIWRQVGIKFKIAPQKAYSFPCAIAGQILFDGANPGASEIHKLLGQKFLPGTINVYFVPRINLPGFDAIGLGFARNVLNDYQLAQPGVIVADSAMSGFSLASDPPGLGHLLAHELGHFLGLWHPEHQQADMPREDLWSRRMLMFPTIFLTRNGDWRDDPGYGELALPTGEVLLRAGALLTQKDLSQLVTDGEAGTARTTAHMPY